jgi:hypothetical protein
MKRTKTLLTPESQWHRTVAYFMQLNRSRPVQLGSGGIEEDLCFFRGTHPLVRNGDVLLATSLNWMAQRYGMTGITSKGVRLKNYHLPLRRGFEQVQLPDDFAGRQWNDPVIGRYVADLRASRRGRVVRLSTRMTSTIRGRASHSPQIQLRRNIVETHPEALCAWWAITSCSIFTGKGRCDGRVVIVSPDQMEG